mmetsp:Transcript_14069/g.23407  ORF Transcript_14069/g.23407 Transcript_14069/m.23407 type:complete len:122 (-) Transcript_14069:165-530(-)
MSVRTVRTNCKRSDFNFLRAMWLVLLCIAYLIATKPTDSELSESHEKILNSAAKRAFGQDYSSYFVQGMTKTVHYFGTTCESSDILVAKLGVCSFSLKGDVVNYHYIGALNSWYLLDAKKD